MNTRFYIFGAFLLDTRNHRLLRDDGETISLTPKEFEVLLVLVENAGNVVGKNALLEAVWKDSFVAEETLMRNVSWLRKKLGSGNDGQKFIETVPKLGYRFTATVAVKDEPAEILVAEKTLTRVLVEKTLTLSDAEEDGQFEQSISRSPLLPASVPPKRVPASLFIAIGVLAVIAIGVYLIFFQKPAPKIVFAGRVVPFAGLPGTEGMPSFSPDSKQIVFGWNGGEGEITDIYVKIIGAGEPVRLTRGASNALFPIFTPDGRNVAFFRSFPETSVIYQVSALGGAERKIVDVQSGGTGFSFFPDGKWVASADRDETGANGIFLIDAETGAKKRLTAPPENFLDQKPQFSPDGKQIVFSRASGWENQDLFVVEAAGGANESRRLTFDNSRLSGAAWSADGKRVIFSSRRGGASSNNLWQIPAAGGEPELLMAGGKNPISPVVAPDGKWVAFTEETRNENIWRYEIGSGGKPSQPRRFIASASGDHSPNLSRDSSRIVFVSSREGNSGIWMTGADGLNPLRLATGTSPRFSPDGRFIAYAEHSTVYIVNVEGGAPRPLVADSWQNNFPAWSADGRWIYFQSNRGGDFNLWRIASDGVGEAVQVTKQGAFEALASHDGKWIYYTKDRESKGLWRVSANAVAETSDETAVPELDEIIFRRSWTITRYGIYFVALAEKPPHKIKFYDFATVQIKEIAETGKSPAMDAPALSALENGKTILYAQHDQNTSSIMLAEIWK